MLLHPGGGVEGALLALLGMIGFLLGSWYGILLLGGQRGTPDLRLFGVLLTAVNAIWGAWQYLLRDPGKPLREEHLAWAAILCGLGLLVTLSGLLLRRKIPSPRSALR
jgi:hypothetical protein